MPETIVLTGPDGTDYSFSGVSQIALRTLGGSTQDFYLTEGTLSIYGNGVYDIKSYASVNVVMSVQDDLYSLLTKTITEVSYPTVTRMNSYVFCECSVLSSVSLPLLSAVPDYAFVSCQRLGSAEFPQVSNIGHCAFQNCILLRSVSLPTCLTIQSSAFIGCDYLDDPYLPSVSMVGDYAFSGCRSLKTISIPNCTSIGNSAFASASSLETVYAANAKYIGNFAFAGCTKLKNVTFTQLSTTGTSCFTSCGFVSVQFPSLSSIAIAAFRSCTSLEYISLPKMNGTINGSAFEGCTSLRWFSVGTYGASSINIGYSAFNYCTSLEKFINLQAFTVGSYAFRMCRQLSAVWLYEAWSRINIYSSAFYGCAKLLSLYLDIYSTTLASLSNVNAFMATPMSTAPYSGQYGTIYVPASRLSAFQTAAVWSAYSSRMVGLTSEEFTSHFAAFIAGMPL